MKVLNTEKEDYHIHSINYSDGMNTVDEIVKFCGEIGMKKICITDHSQAALDAGKIAKKGYRSIVKKWQNVHNDVEVTFGVEADILNEQGDICSNIQGIEGDFIILSFHDNTYSGDPKKVTEAFLNAINRHHDRIKSICHVWVTYGFDIDLKKVVEEANKYKIPIELDCLYINKNVEGLLLALKYAEQVIVDSDAHTLNEIRDSRKKGFKFLKENGFIE